MTRYPLLASRLYNQPLMIDPGKAEVIEMVFRAYADGRVTELPKPEAKKTAPAPLPMERTEDGYARTDGGVAILPVHGTLVQRAGGIDALSGMTGYNMISRRFQAALADPKVRGIVMEFDSMGGEVAGVFELAQQIAAATKPVYAHANESMFSAAYALGVGAEKLFVAQTGMVGSVGVVMMHVDQSGRDAKQGLTYTPIFAGAKKVQFSGHAPLSDAAHEAAQARVDHLYDLFVSHVADARAISADVVKGTEAGHLTPGEAIDLEMADGQATLIETIQRMQDTINSSGFTGYSRPTRALSERSNTMEAKDQKGAGATAATDEQLAAARAEGASAEAAKAPAIKAEAEKVARERVKAILGCDAAKERPTLANHLAFETEMTADQATAMLAKAGVETPAKPANALDVAMRDTNPKIGVGADKEGGDKPATTIDTPNIYEMRRKAAGHAK